MVQARVGILSLTTLLVICVARSCHAETHQFSASELRLIGARVADGKLVLDRWFDAGDARSITLEAENALDLVANPPDGARDERCSGGLCIERSDGARFPIRITQAGKFRRWSRALFPTGGTWCHSESVNFAEPEWIIDRSGEGEDRWMWVPGPVYELQPGLHLLWLHNWHGGAKLDKIAFLPVDAPAPNGVGPEPVPATDALEALALTSPLSVAGLKSVDAVSWPGVPAEKLALSLNGGRTWMPVLDDGSISGQMLPAFASIVLRASLDAATSAAAAPSINYSIDPDAFVSLENDRVRATFAKHSGALMGLFDKRANVECIPGADGSPTFSLSRMPEGAGAPEEISADEIELLSLEVKGPTLSARYQVQGAVLVDIEISLADAEVAFAMRVNNRSESEVLEPVFPNVSGIALGEDSRDDLLITPNWQGGLKTVDPAHSGGGGVPYPAGGSMAWLDLYQEKPAHGVTLQSRDPELMGCRLGADAKSGSDSLTFTCRRYARIAPGQQWTAPAAVIGLHEGDWHVAADSYRAWAKTWMRLPKPPEWVREADGWYGLVVSANSNHVEFSRIPDYLKQMRELGTNYIQVWGQMTGGNNCDSLPYPNPVLGSVDDFRKAIAEVQRWGGHVTFYVSSQFWKVDFGDAPVLGTTPRELIPASVPIWDWNEWREYALRSYSGGCFGDSELSEADQAKYGTRWQRTVPCPYTDAWANRHLQYWCVDQYGGTYGANGIYLDETCAAGERYCFATNHGHEHHGIWGASLARIMERMVTDGRKRDPDWMFAMEGCGDAIGQFCDVHLISPASAKAPGQYGKNKLYAPEVFHYTFPEYLLYDGVANGVYGGIGAENVFLNVHLHSNRYDSFSVDPAAAFIRLRQKTKQLLYRARFVDDVGLKCDDSEVQAKMASLVDDANNLRLVNVVNKGGRTGARVRVNFPGEGPVFGYYFDLDGAEGRVEVAVEGDEASFEAPTCKASTVIVARKCEPIIRPELGRIVVGGTGGLRVTVTNITRRALFGRLTLGGALADFGEKPVSALVFNGGSEQFIIPVKAPVEQPMGCVTGTVRFEGFDETIQRPCECLVTSPFEVSGELWQDRLYVDVRNLSSTALTVSIMVRGEGVEKLEETSFKGRGGTRVAVELPRPLLEPATFDVTLRYGDQEEKHSVQVRPELLNPGFERVVGNRPADWAFQNEDLASLDHDNPAEGERSLKLAGKKGAFLEAHQPLQVRPGMPYEVRCKVRRGPGVGKTVGPCVVLYLKAGFERYVHLQKETDLPADQWNEYVAEFTWTDDAREVMLYMYNVDSDATVWFDDVRLSPLRVAF